MVRKEKEQRTRADKWRRDDERKTHKRWGGRDLMRNTFINLCCSYASVTNTTVCVRGRVVDRKCRLLWDSAATFSSLPLSLSSSQRFKKKKTTCISRRVSTFPHRHTRLVSASSKLIFGECILPAATLQQLSHIWKKTTVTHHIYRTKLPNGGDKVADRTHWL